MTGSGNGPATTGSSAQTTGAGGQPPIEDADYYVAPDGKDTNQGTIDQPFATWQKFADVAQPGQLCYVRGGTYTLTGFRRDGIRINTSGTPEQPIRMAAYPGETPVLDCGQYTYDSTKYCVMHTADWWHLKGLSVANIKVDNTDGSAFAAGIHIAGSNNVLELLDSHHHEGTGLGLVGTAGNNLVLNCDAHHNYDPSAGGGNADGFRASYLDATRTGNVFRGCRSWSNSDDGFDLWDSEAPVTIEQSVSFWNGFIPGTQTAAGNGDGFKCGRNMQGPRHVVTHCAAFENRARGFDSNGAAGVLEWTQNTAFGNGTISFQALGSAAHHLRNNIAFGKPNSFGPNVNDPYNSWSLSVTADQSDFVSTDSSGTDDPRQMDGSRPRPDFLKLHADSDLVAAGENNADLGM